MILVTRTPFWVIFLFLRQYRLHRQSRYHSRAYCYAELAVYPVVTIIPPYLSSVLNAPIHRGMARLSRPGWLWCHHDTTHEITVILLWVEASVTCVLESAAYGTLNLTFLTNKLCNSRHTALRTAIVRQTVMFVTIIPWFVCYVKATTFVPFVYVYHSFSWSCF